MSAQTNPTFSIWHTERQPANPADYRMELCIGVDANHVIARADGTVREGEIPGGRCAVLRVIGDTHNLEPAATYLTVSGYPQAARRCGVSQFTASVFFLAEPEQGTAAELHLPLK